MGLLAETLRAAVPMWELEMADWPRYMVEARARELSTIVCSSGDNLMFKQRTKKGQQETAKAFNALAQGIACLSICCPDFDANAHINRLGQSEDAFRGD